MDTIQYIVQVDIYMEPKCQLLHCIVTRQHVERVEIESLMIRELILKSLDRKKKAKSKKQKSKLDCFITIQ